jgi:DNA-binding Lrp family transcriptional regulator
VKEYAFHPIANMFPLLEGGEFNALVEDIRAHGLQQDIVLYEGMILDGRNRYRASLEAGVEPRFREMLFGSYADAVAYVIGANILRRHLTAEQRWKLIEELLKAKPEQSDRQVADTTKSSPTTVGRRRRELEGEGAIPKVGTRTDTKGRPQPGRKTARKGRDVSTMDTSAPTPVESELIESIAGSEPAGEPIGTTESSKTSGAKPPRTHRTKQQIQREHADQSASAICKSVLTVLDDTNGFADAIVGCLCTDYIETLVEIAQHPKFAPIIAAVMAKLGSLRMNSR